MEYTALYHSPVGPLILSSDGTSLTGLRPYHYGTCQDILPIFDAVRNWLDRYFAGDAPDPRELPLALNGTPFQRRVWEALLEIPWGHTCSYGDIARRIGCPRGAQATGQALSRNPIFIIVPCHRVLGADGSITGYAGGLDMKRQLLAIEHIHIH